MSNSDSFEILTNLCPEIEQGIRNILSETSTKSKINAELERIRKECTNDSHPAARYALLLFRKYANEVNALGYIDKTKNSSVSENSSQNEVGSIPSKLSEDVHGDVISTDVSQMSGYDAMKSHLFQIRFLCLLFSLTTAILFAVNPELFIGPRHSWATNTAYEISYNSVSSD